MTPEVRGSSTQDRLLRAYTSLSLYLHLPPRPAPSPLSSQAGPLPRKPNVTVTCLFRNLFRRTRSLAVHRRGTTHAPHLIISNLFHDVIHSLPKVDTTNLYGGTDSMWPFVPACLFNDYYFLVLLFATSLKMAVRNRVESSSALPPYQSSRRHHSKNTTFHTPAFESIFSAFFSTEQIASPVDR